MAHYWAWGGKYIGFRNGNYLYSKKGTPIGYFNNSEVYNFNGRYLCEVMNGRLIVKPGKCVVGGTMAKPCNMSGTAYADYTGYAMIAGYQDFVWDE